MEELVDDHRHKESKKGWTIKNKCVRGESGNVGCIEMNARCI